MQGTRLTVGVAAAVMMSVAYAPHTAWAKQQPGKTPKTKAESAQPKTDSGAPQDENMMKLLLFPDADPDEGPPPLTVHFTVEIYEGDEAKNPKFDWEFGDGSPVSHEQNPTHTYKRAGEYKAQVKASDATGRSGNDEVPISVEAPE
jgi:uncharacterized membrane protein